METTRHTWISSECMLESTTATSKDSDICTFMKKMPRNIGLSSTNGVKTSFFKDRHYLNKEWGRHFSVGCGARNTIFPLLATYPIICSCLCFSPRAVNLVKMHKDFTKAKVNAFPCDLIADDLCAHVAPSSVDIVTMIFVLSAVSPEKMPLAIQNIRKVLKPNGCILFRDYATGDLAQERFTGKEQKISENFYVRGDDEFLENLFKGSVWKNMSYVASKWKIGRKRLQ